MTGSQPAPGTDSGEPRPTTENGPRHRSGRRGLPVWVLPTAGALALGLLVGVTVADRSADPTGARGPAVVAEQPAPGAAPSPAATGPGLDTSTGLTRAKPVQVDIPAIEVSSPLVQLGLNDDRTLEVPVDYGKAGWFNRGSFPGDPQGPPAVIAGHVDDFSGPAVFARLGELEQDAEIVVIRADNSAAVFRLVDVSTFAKDEFPAQELYAPVPTSELVLITCTGPFDEQARSYEENLVVRARLDLERSRAVTDERADAGAVAPGTDLPNV